MYANSLKAPSILTSIWDNPGDVLSPLSSSAATCQSSTKMIISSLWWSSKNELWASNYILYHDLWTHLEQSYLYRSFLTTHCACLWYGVSGENLAAWYIFCISSYMVLMWQVSRSSSSQHPHLLAPTNLSTMQRKKALSENLSKAIARGMS